MAQPYDISAKVLFRYSRGVVAQALFGGPVVEWVNVELPEVRNPRVDLLARVETGDLRHVELQTENDPKMPRRKAEYYCDFWRLLDTHVAQVVHYMGREPLRMPAQWKTPSMTYEFHILNLREMDGEPLLASDDWGDNVLALLARADQERVIQAVEAQIRRLKGEEQANALQTFVILSGIIGAEEKIGRRLQKRHDRPDGKQIHRPHPGTGNRARAGAGLATGLGTRLGARTPSDARPGAGYPGSPVRSVALLGAEAFG